MLVTKKRKQDAWAVLNFEADPDNFDFEVALGAIFFGDPEPKSATIYMPSRNETVVCRVFVLPHRVSRQKQPRGLRKLEVISPLKWEGVTEECQRQLALALWLFKPMPFWISPWERHGDVRIFDRVSPPYSLRGGEVGSFCRFAKRLLPFHLNRNIYHFVRYFLEAFSDEATDYLEPSDPKGDAFLSKNAHLMIAVDLFEQAHRDWHLSHELRMILLLMAAETLFTDEDKGELAYRLSHRMSVLNGADEGGRKGIFEEVRQLYGLRSRLIHGSLYRRKGGFVEVSPADVVRLSNIVRASLLYLVALTDHGRDQILRTLDRAVFDQKEIIVLRLEANHFWGFGKSPDEYLYAAKWG